MPSSDDPREPGADAPHEAARTESALLLDLAAAWADRSLRLAYQPQLNLVAGRVSAFEALLRWPHPERGDVPPATFIPLAEKAGLIDEIGEWVLEQACIEAAGWPDDVNVAVNLSAIQFHGATLSAAVAACLKRAGLPPARLELEITEGALIPADAATLLTFQTIRGTGVRIVMDDFDVGYSSLSYLVKFDFDKVKIDRFFTARLGASQDGHAKARAIVRAVIGLCNELGIPLLAEGVETREQLMFLKDAQCAEIQGFLCGPPLPASAIPATLSTASATLRKVAEGSAADAAGAPWSELAPFARIAEMLNDVIIVTTAELGPSGPSIVYVNPAFTRLTGYAAAEVIGRTPRILQGPGTSRATLDNIAAGLRDGRPVHEKVLNFSKSGVPYWLDLKIVPLRDGDGPITHFAAIQRDITLDKRRLDELGHLADCDTLTGIPNRRALLRAVDAAIAAAAGRGAGAGRGKGPCLILIDVDHFKRINDDQGHPVGDAVLCGIADRLGENVRRVDVIGRIGGDEFAVCMPLISLSDARATALRLRGAVAGAALATPAGPVEVTVSLGVACFAHGDNVDTIYARADAAMYAAKRAGRNRVRGASVTRKIPSGR
jgi:diguanylate cyclase (GGDEF)-like protein/PAS domain S-box-containing protein